MNSSSATVTPSVRESETPNIAVPFVPYGISGLRGIASSADDVVVGMIDSVKAAEMKYGMPWTSYVVTVVDSLKGNLAPGSRADVLQEGGIGAQGGTFFVGDGLLQVGQEYVLFSRGPDRVLLAGASAIRVVDGESRIRIIQGLKSALR